MVNERTIEIYRTDKQGTIIFSSDGNDITVNTNAYKVTDDDLATSQEKETSPSTEEIIVHITSTGSKYHRAGCSYLKSDLEVTLDDAISRGLGPCKVCNPPTK